MTDPLHKELEIPREEIEARARDNIERRYVEGARRWRSPRNAMILVATMLAYGALPFVPQVALVTGAPPAASLAVMVLMSLVAVLATVAMHMQNALHVSYRVLSMLETVVWVTGSMVLIALSGTVRNWYWLHLGLFLFGMSTVVYRHRAYLFLVGFNLAGLAMYFLIAGKLGDGLIAALVGLTMVIFQRASTTASRSAEAAHARAELIAERAGAALAQAERDRIARDLHDGLGAELTNVLWQAQSLEGSSDEEVEVLVDRVRASLVELRGIVHGAKAKAMSARELTRELRRVVTILAGDTLRCEVVEDVADASRTISPAACHHLIHIAKEAVHNARHHGEPTRVDVTLRITDQIELIVEDDGKGFDPAESPSGGLAHIRSRAAELGGEASWQCGDAGGTTFSFHAPIP